MWLIPRLDRFLTSRNYKYMRASDIGSGALKATQEAWLAERNNCTAKSSLVEAYRKRIDEICECIQSAFRLVKLSGHPRSSRLPKGSRETGKGVSYSLE